jgi:hypothetical protein
VGEPIERGWKPRMDGIVMMTEAVTKLVADMAAVQSRQ